MSEAAAVEVPIVKGFKVASVHCGLKPDDLDFILIVSDVACSTAADYAANEFVSESVKVMNSQLETSAHRIRAIAVNTGCANTFTGDLGQTNAKQVTGWIAERVGCTQEEVLLLSSGKLGTQLPMDKIRQGVDLAAASLGDDWNAAARAIRTTDTTTKIWWRYIYGVRILGIASAQHCVLVTDALISAEDLRNTLSWAVFSTFAESVFDGYDAPDETFIILANELSGIHIEGGYWKNWGKFGLDVRLICDELAWLRVKHENGATKIVQIRVTRAPDDKPDEVTGWFASQQIAYAIATSVTVRVGFYGNHVNWGDILAAAGSAGVPLDPKKISLWIVPNNIADNWPGNALAMMLFGEPTQYDEAQAQSIVSLPRFNIVMDCGLGTNEALFTTSDLNHDYISMNGNYRS